VERINLDEDIKPLSEFRANAADLIAHVRETGRPLLLTQRGHSSAVVLGVRQYEQLVEEVELLRDVQTARKELRAGKGVSHARAKAVLTGQRK